MSHVVVCVVTKELVNSPDGDVSSSVGWIEKDGKEADFPTHDTENVYIGDVVDVHVEVHINPCYSWYVLLPVFLFVCLYASPFRYDL